MSIEIKTIPERKTISVSKSGDLPAGTNIKFLVNDIVFENLEFTVPENKIAHIRIDIIGNLSDAT